MTTNDETTDAAEDLDTDEDTAYDDETADDGAVQDFDEAPDGMVVPLASVEDEPLRVGWEVSEDGNGDWVLYLYEIGAVGAEELLLAELPLDPDIAAEMGAAMGVAYQSMTGEKAPEPANAGFAGETDGDADVPWWKRSTWANRPRFQMAALGVMAALLLLVFVLNLFS